MLLWHFLFVNEHQRLAMPLTDLHLSLDVSAVDPLCQDVPVFEYLQPLLCAPGEPYRPTVAALINRDFCYSR